MRERQPSNGQSRDAETIALAEAFAAAALKPRRSRWDRLKTAVDRGGLVKALLALVGGAAVALVILGMRVERTADALARKADVGAAIERHALQPQPKDIEQDRRLDSQSAEIKALITESRWQSKALWLMSHGQPVKDPPPGLPGVE